jgi:DNA-binding NarL/FixJ family response regulator
LSGLEYDRRAQEYRPVDPAGIEREVLRLTREGLKIRDVASALKLNPHEVAQILARASLEATRR